MTPAARLFTFFILAATLTTAATGVAAQTSDSAGSVAVSAAANPVAQVRDARSWEYGPFVNGGNGIGERSGYRFLWAGFQLSKPLTPVLHAGVFSGQFEMGGNIMPFWQAYTPSPYYQNYKCDEPDGTTYTCSLLTGGGAFRGVSLTPVIFRWNFLTRSRRIQPWVQAAGGLIYTTHKFPPNFQSTQTLEGETIHLDGGTSVWNFSPQGGGGIHYFIRPKRSIDLGINAMHISSASLGDRNPGVNASVQVQLGYTFWK